MNREHVAVRRRRQEAFDSLEFEREREAALTQRLEPMIRDVEAWRADERAFAAMSADDVQTLREIGFAQARPAEDSRARIESTIGELEAQIADSQRRQRAFAAYAEALEEGEA